VLTSANDDNPLRCSFCGKFEGDVEKLFAGPRAYICTDCVDMCHEALERERKPSRAERLRTSAD
jgi:ATP-dependent Clp protease ATP-binding subunit ClpX